MHRVGAASLCALIAVTALGAPAPWPKPWVDGWEKPVNPRRDCRFDRKGDKLIISLPGGDRELNLPDDKSTVPQLQRNVRGSFVMQVRIGGFFQPAPDNCRRAGFVLTDGVHCLTAGRVALGKALIAEGGYTDARPPTLFVGRAYTRGWRNRLLESPQIKWPAYLRLERRENTLRIAVSQDSKEWQQILERSFSLRNSVKVGVMAETTGPGAFKVEFSEFKLIRFGTRTGSPSVGSKILCKPR
jgi:regulation of enolase protein 1 (concanavalin A-like superfamily)